MRKSEAEMWSSFQNSSIKLSDPAVERGRIPDLTCDADYDSDSGKDETDNFDDVRYLWPVPLDVN